MEIVADHIPTFCVFNDVRTFFREPTTVMYYDKKNYKKANYRNQLKNQNFTSVYEKTDPDEAYSEFLNLFSPISQNTFHSNPPKSPKTANGNHG